MPTPTFFWHDYETSGADPMRDRPLQFAGIRTDAELNPVGEPIDILCQPALDTLPHPQATLITGITPQDAARDGLIEAEFAARVHEQLALPGTCGAGYNSLQFDDAVTRHLLYRNFHEPYAREWQNGNSRWDIIDLARMCHALRPAGIQWPEREPGVPSFKLEELATANQLNQEHAHDALSDVHATLDLARLLRHRQPRLWNWYFSLRHKRTVQGLLDLAHGTPLVHVSSRYPASEGCLRIIVPLCLHPSRNTEVIVVPLDRDPDALLRLDADAIADRVFTPRADLPEDVEPISLRTLHINRSPALAPLSVLKPADIQRLGLDMDRCMAWAERLQRAESLAEKLRRVYADRTPADTVTDPDTALYQGFLPDADKPLLERVRATPPDMLKASLPFRDPRYPELLFRYRARNWPDSLNAEEAARWLTLRRERLTGSSPAVGLGLAAYFDCIRDLRKEPGRSGRDLRLLDQLEAWGHELEAGLAQGSSD